MPKSGIGRKKRIHRVRFIRMCDRVNERRTELKEVRKKCRLIDSQENKRH